MLHKNREIFDEQVDQLGGGAIIFVFVRPDAAGILNRAVASC